MTIEYDEKEVERLLAESKYLCGESMVDELAAQLTAASQRIEEQAGEIERLRKRAELWQETAEDCAVAKTKEKAIGIYEATVELEKAALRGDAGSEVSK